jgi:hypothetical protein
VRHIETKTAVLRTELSQSSVRSSEWISESQSVIGHPLFICTKARWACECGGAVDWSFTPDQEANPDACGKRQDGHHVTDTN